jgi:lipopolysaccharide transport system ATP-binding protein
MSNDTLISVQSVSKKFCRHLKRSLWYGVQDIGAELLGRAKKPELRKHEFWAVNDVSFELKRGECLGLIGHNGAGKSTLLKMLNGLIKPDTGKITMKGRIGALIELGTGFNPILTGRENVYNNGAVLGFTKKEIDKKFDSIIDFAEIGDFIDTPVQNYSSGMKVRLGFAVASHMEPDVLLIDEVLAVGDMGFVMKCFNRVDQILQNTAVIFVSHSMPLIFRISSKLIFMDKGIVQFCGDNVSKGIDLYYSKFNFIPSFKATEDIEIKSISINDNLVTSDGNPIKVERLKNLKFEFEFRIDVKHPNPEISLAIYDKELRAVAQFVNENSFKIKNQTGIINMCVEIPRILFSKGIYSLTVVISNKKRGQVLLRAQSVAFFQVISELDIWTPIQLEGVLTQKI